MPRLDIYHKFKLMLQVQVSEEALSIGRSKDSQVSLTDPEVSRNHASIRKQGEGWEIENLGINGTRLNGALLKSPAVLHFGDRLYIGSHVVVFQEDGAPVLHGEAILEAPTARYQSLGPFAQKL